MEEKSNDSSAENTGTKIARVSIDIVKTTYTRSSGAIAVNVLNGLIAAFCIVESTYKKDGAMD